MGQDVVGVEVSRNGVWTRESPFDISSRALEWKWQKVKFVGEAKDWRTEKNEKERETE